MLLALDVGNTNITVGAFKGESLQRTWRLSTDLKKTTDEYGVALKSLWPAELGPVEWAIYGSVVPDLDRTIETAVRQYLGVKPEVVSYLSPLGIRLKVDKPREVGVDRILNALAVYRLYGGPAVVIDFGTATTFDCVSIDGEYLGGAILPGPRLAAAALHEHTAQLPEVAVAKPKRVIGKNTVECIQAGLYYGYLGMLERVLHETIAEMGTGRRSPKFIATGGLAKLFAGDLANIPQVPDLTLQGLRLAHEALGKASGRARKRIRHKINA